MAKATMQIGCPKCGSINIGYESAGDRIEHGSHFWCRECNHSWLVRYDPSPEVWAVGVVHALEYLEKSEGRMRKTKRVALEITPEQHDAIEELRTLGTYDNRTAWIRGLIAAEYERITGKEFPPDPIHGYQGKETHDEEGRS